MQDVDLSASLDLARHGAEWHSGAIANDLDYLRAVLRPYSDDHAGTRIFGVQALRPFLSPDGSIGAVATNALGRIGRPVRAILFDKRAGTNWALGWHQDRTICVRERVEVEGFGNWTLKKGLQHVEPPFELLSQMITLRIHLDDVPMTNAPLLIAPGSHKQGRIPVEAIDEAVRRCGIHACTASAGDIWLYATPILHASEAASKPSHRRVLQVDFAARNLPGGLEWLGV